MMMMMMMGCGRRASHRLPLLLVMMMSSVLCHDELEVTQMPAESDADRVTYQGSQVISVCRNSTGPDLVTEPLVQNQDVEVWGRNETCWQYFVSSDKVEEVKQKLSGSGLVYSVLIEDLQRNIDTENPPQDDDDEQIGKIGQKHQHHKEGWLIRPLIHWLLWGNRNRPGRPFANSLTASSTSSTTSSSNNLISSAASTQPNGHRMNWVSYHRVSDINGYLDYLGQTYPELVTVATLGTSVEGRPLKYVKVSSGAPNAKSFWIDGGIHAREWISPATVSYILYELVENRDAHARQVDGIDFYIMPVMNPDGYEYTHTRDRLWRKNRSKGGYYCQGTDLNRNWGYMWGGKGSSSQMCQEIYGGRSAFSEPETRAVSSFITSSVPNAKGFLTFHSYGQYILYPYGFDTNQLPEDHQDLERVGRKMAQAMRQTSGSHYTVGNSANSLYPASGGADDWAKGVAGIKYSYTIELRDKGRYGFVLPAQYIQPTAKEALAAVKVISAEIQALP